MDTTRAELHKEIVEQLVQCDQEVFDVWIFLNILTMRFPAGIVEEVFRDELPKQTHDVQRYWRHGCNCCGQLN